MEFSKKIVMALGGIFTACLVTSYVLAWFGRDPVENLSITIASGFSVVLVSYFAKSFGEKNSRNKYAIDLEEGASYESGNVRDC